MNEWMFFTCFFYLVFGWISGICVTHLYCRLNFRTEWFVSCLNEMNDHFEIRPLLTQEFLSGGWNNQIKQNDWNSLRLFYTYWFVYCGIYIIILVHRWGFCEWSSQKRVDKNQFHFKRKEKLPNTTYKIHTQLHTHIQIRFDLIQFNLLRWIYRTVQKVWTEIGQPIGF